MTVLHTPEHEVETRSRPGHMDTLSFLPPDMGPTMLNDRRSGMPSVEVDLSSPLAEGLQVSSESGERLVDIYAVTTSDATNHRSYALYGYEDKEGEYHYGVGSISTNGEVLRVGKSHITRPASKRKGKHELLSVEVSHSDDSPDEYAIEYLISPTDRIAQISKSKRTFLRQDAKQPKIFTNRVSKSKSKAIRFKLALHNREAQRRPSRSKRWVGKTALLAMLATSPNGPADLLFDAVDDNPARLVDDYTIEGKYGDANYQVPRESVSDVLEAIDANDAEKISELASDYETKLVSKTRLEAVNDSIDNSTTVEEVVRSTNMFSEEYGVAFSTLEEKEVENYTTGNIEMSPFSGSLGTTKQVATELVDFLSLFPKNEFKDLFRAEGLTITGGIKDTTDRGTVWRIMRDSGRLFGADSDAGGLGGSNIVIHEGGSFLRLTPNFGEVIVAEYGHQLKTPHLERLGGLPRLPFNIFSNIINKPSDPSLYALWGESDEHHSHTFMRLISEGVPNPNRGYSFDSQLNREMIGLLVEIENILPGFTAHLADLGSSADHENPVETFFDQSKLRLALFGFILISLRGNRSVRTTRRPTRTL